MRFADRAIDLFDRISRPRIVRAHCDIPCGIYDPHAAQVAALTCIRMLQLIENLPQPDMNDKAAGDLYAQQISRYVAVKEEHAKICEQELVILWTDYFRPEHVEQHPQLPDLFWKTAKLTSQVKQTTSMENAQALLTGCQQIAEIFWATKNVPTRRGSSNQTAGGEFVYVAN